MQDAPYVLEGFLEGFADEDAVVKLVSSSSADIGTALIASNELPAKMAAGHLKAFPVSCW